MSETPQSGRDLARQALAAYKAGRRPGPENRSTVRRTHRRRASDGRDPQNFATVLERLSTEQGWTSGVRGGDILARWPELCPQYVGRVHPVVFDTDRGRLDLRPTSDAYAAQLRLLGGQLCRQINDKVGSTVVRSIRVLPVGAAATDTPAAGTGPAEPAPAPGPIRTRETASPGYHQALAAALSHKPDTATTNPYVRAAIDRQNQALTEQREPETAFTDAVAALEALAADEPADSLQASIRAALDYKHGGGQPVRRAFDAA
ncbi:DciA family protein [Streptomyces sp. sk2.1]|uniref:DciA family protein n=1 Tax=Streptomyces sp. sk2.1 TaxID=2478959 RepID=UPI0011E797F1|nr:DciA family protein [Streptomyces sp. sk2.1]TXS68904.1 DUF721 domain-containing protein [Streptomyces sp. sk2.1]